MSITTTSGTVLNGLYVGSSTPVANQKGLLIDNKYFIPLVEGSSSGTDTSDATAVASDIIAGKTAYTVDGKVTGTLPKLTVTYDDTMFIYTAAHDGYLNAGDQVLDFSAATSGTASGAGMLQGDTAWVNGQRIVGEIPIVTASISGNTVTVPYGYHESDSTFTVDSYTGAYTVNPGTSSQTLSTSGKYMTSDIVVSGDSNLLAENIKKGVSIFGIVGTLESGGGSSAEYYKCASVSSGASQPEGYTLSMVTTLDDPSYKKFDFTMEDPSKTGLERRWFTSDGLYRLSIGTSYNLSPVCIIDLIERIDDTIDEIRLFSAPAGYANPWDATTWIDEMSGMSEFGVSWTVSPAVSGGSTWSGYKAVFDSTAGTWSFSDTVTEGLSYTSVTPIVGGIYSADALVIVSLLYTGTPTLTSPTGMTSESSDEWEISASSFYSTNSAPWKAFDGITGSSSGWTGASNSSWWLQWQNKTKQVLVQRLRFQGTASGDIAQQAVTSFILQGSDDGSTWTDLYTASGLTWTTGYEWKEFTFSNNKSYYYHRLANITVASNYPTIVELETYDL